MRGIHCKATLMHIKSLQNNSVFPNNVFKPAEHSLTAIIVYDPVLIYPLLRFVFPVKSCLSDRLTSACQSHYNSVYQFGLKPFYLHLCPPLDTVDSESLYIHDSVDHPVTLHSGGTSYPHLLNQENMMESPCNSVDFCSNASCILRHSPTSWMNKKWKENYTNYTCFETLFRRLCSQRERSGRETAFG